MKVNFDMFLAVLTISLAVGVVSTTTAKAKIFRSIRTSIRGLWDFLGDLVSCPYCTCHWLSIFIILVYQPIIIEKYFLLDLLISIFATIGLSALTSGLIMKLIPFAGDIENAILNDADASFPKDGVFLSR